MANSSKLLSRTRNVALALAITAVLGACGGDGGGRRNNGNQPAAVTGDTFAVTTTGRLLNFNRTSGGIQSSTQITGLGTDNVIGFDIRPIDNTLIVVGRTGTTGRIFRVDPASGAATLLSTINVATVPVVLSATNFGADFNPVPDRLRLVGNNGQNLRINVATGATTVDGTLTLNGTTVTGVTEVGYNNNFGNACRTQLFYLDTAGNRLLTTTAPNDGILTVVGSFGSVMTNAATSSFEVFTDAAANSTASAVVTVGGIPTVFSLNLTSGALTAGSPIVLNPGENLVGIAAMSTPATVTQTAGELTGLTAANQLFTFNSAAPNKVCTGPTAISGLTTGENVVGIDTRASDSNLYGVGVTPGAMGAPGTGRVFQINRTTGAISAAVSIAPVGSPMTPTPIMGTNFGVDFNPVPDLLRVVSDAGQNLRINATTGLVQALNAMSPTDGAINPAGNVLNSAAYTNSFGPTAPGTTTLYTIDTASSTLNIQNPPNNGTQAPVANMPGNLGITGITGVSGFDINGVNNLAVAGLQVGAATTTTLYGINLATGAATAFAGGNIGAGVGVGTPPLTGAIRGMTFTNNPQVTAIGLTATGNQLVNFSTTTNLGVAANLATISTTAITGLQGGENIVGLDFRTSSIPAINNRLYVVTDQSRTYVVDPATGAATQQLLLIGNAGDTFANLLGNTAFGIDFNPAADRLRTVAGTRNLRSVLDSVPMLTAGTTFTDTALSRVVPALNPAAVIGGAAYSNSTPGMPLPTATTLFTLDPVNDMLFVQNPPNNGAQVFVGRLGVDVTSVGGFDITGPNTAYAVLTTAAVMGGPAAVTNGLYSINLANGAATLVGAVNVNSPIHGLALPVSATDPTGGVTTATGVAGGTLITFQTSATGVGTVGTVLISGLAMGETITDIDFQPATAVAPAAGMAATPATSGLLFGVSNLGNVYTISATSGVATNVGLVNDPVNVGASMMAFAGVNGTAFGIDFNPMPNLLRVISNTGQNLRINANVSPALARLDVAVNVLTSTSTPALPVLNAVAAAYTNAFPLVPPVVPPVPPAVAPAATTVLFDIDLATNTLQRQDPNPNMGMLTQVGRLDPIFTFAPNASFDMVGGENGLVLAVLQRTGATQSSLYRVNLLTGQATLIGDIGPAMGPTLLGGLALRLR